MPFLAIPVAWQMLTAFGSATFLPFLKKIPWQVWAVIGGIVLILMYGHYRENKGYNKCLVKTEEAAKREVARQKKVGEEEIAKAKLREADAKAKLDTLAKELDNAVLEASKLKTSKNVCLPSSITDRLRGMSR